MRITYVGHACVLIETAGLKILTDPLLRTRIFGVVRRVAPGASAEQLRGIDLVLVSHAHHDHLDVASLKQLDGSPRVALPATARPVVEAVGYPTEVMGVGDEVRLGDVVVEAVRADHDGRRKPWSHDRGSLGYVVRGPTGSVYFAGDTDVYAAMADLAAIDVALLPVSGWGPRLPAGHMGPDEAAEAVRLIEPRVAIPIHWGTYERMAMRADPLRDQRAQRFVDQVSAGSPSVRAVLLQPGASIDLDASTGATPRGSA